MNLLLDENLSPADTDAIISSHIDAIRPFVAQLGKAVLFIGRNE